MTANVSQLSSLPEGGEAAHALSHAYISTTKEMPFIPSDKSSGFVKENLAGKKRGERSWAVQAGLDPVSNCRLLQLSNFLGLGRDRPQWCDPVQLCTAVWVHFGV